MSTRRSSFLLIAFTAIWLAGGGSHAQQPVQRVPGIGYVFPAGGEVGQEVDVVIGGQFLDGTSEVVVSGGEGITAEVLKYRRPLSQGRMGEFRMKLDEARKNPPESIRNLSGRDKLRHPEAIALVLQEAGATQEEIELFEEMRLQRMDPKRQDNRQIEEKVAVRVRIAKDAPPGPRVLRVLARGGLSNPRNFVIGDLPETAEPPAPPEGDIPPVPVVLPAVLNGQILPGETDRFDFDASRGQRLVVSVRARDLIPYLADAVPGWFQPVVGLFDAEGNELATSGGFRFTPDPVLVYDIEKSGRYRIEVRDALYRGREDFVYRISAGTIPFVASIHPLGGTAGKPATVEIAGWNLKARKVRVQPPGTPGIHRIPSLSNGFVLADTAFDADSLPEWPSVEPDDSTPHAPLVPVPVAINGRFEVPGDVDVFAFRCAKGDVLWIETFARRLNSPADTLLRITDSAGKQLAFHDDCEDREAALLTHHADARLEFKAPEDGLYYVHVAETQDKGGADFSYRMKILPGEPDFAVRMTPSALNGRPGASIPVTLHAFRKGGFDGDIQIRPLSVPDGLRIDGAIIPAGVEKIRATVAFPPLPIARPTRLEFEAVAMPGDKPLVREVVPADDVLQAFFYRHLVPAPEFLAACPGVGEKMRPMPEIVVSGPVKFSADGTGRAEIRAAGRFPFPIDQIALELNEPPEGVAIEGVVPSDGGAVVSFRAEPGKLEPGTRGNLILEFSPQSGGADKSKPGAKFRGSGFLPAIPFQIDGSTPSNPPAEQTASK